MGFSSAAFLRPNFGDQTEITRMASRERMFTIRAEAESGAVFVREAVVELIGARHEALPNSQELFRFLAWKQGGRTKPNEPEPLSQ